jgi:DNA-binding transcriptional regulator YdaS (Cro superfamily)
MEALQRAIDHFGSQAKLAERLSVKPMAVSQWKKRGVPPERCGAIEDATGGAVTRAELRPDIFGTRATA